MSSWRDFLQAPPGKCTNAKTANCAKTSTQRPHLDPFGTIGTFGIETFTAETANLPLVAIVVPAVPDEWCKGVALICDRPAVAGIGAQRWDSFGRSCRRLLIEKGATLHAAGWDSLDLFGLHPTVPEAAPDCWGVAWLLRDFSLGEITAETVSLIAGEGVSTRARKMARQARIEAVVAWKLADL